MAQASKTTETIVKAVEEERITLVLTTEEAAVLRRLARAVGGDINGPRAAITRISEALDEVGVQAHNGVSISVNKIFGIPSINLDSA